MVMSRRANAAARVPPTAPRRGTTDEAFDALLLAMLARKPFLVLIGEDGPQRRRFLGALVRRIEGDGAEVLPVEADSGDTVERLLTAAGGTANDDIDAVAAAIEERLDAAGSALLAIDRADRLPDSTIRDLAELARTPSPGGRCLQVLLCGDPGLRRVLAQRDLAEWVRSWGVAAEWAADGEDEPADSRILASSPPPRRASATVRALATGTVAALGLAVLTAGVSALGVLEPARIRGQLRAALEAALDPPADENETLVALARPAVPPPAPVPAPAPVPEVSPAPVPATLEPAPPSAPPIAVAPAPAPVPLASVPEPPHAAPGGTGMEAPMRLLPPQPVPPPAELSPRTRLASLAQRGQRQIATRRLTSPAGDNAFETMQAMQAIDAGSAEADALRAAIKNTYRMLGERAEASGAWDEARSLYERALRVDPDDAEFRARLTAASQ
jgi:tetratricopeptide (TPR) repeat protein